MKSHILYLTNDCNLRCEYCFQSGHHNTKNVIKKKNINKILKEILKSEPDNVSTICFFGGEPFLEIDKIKYTYDECKKIKNQFQKDFAFNTITNGTLIKKNIETVDYLVKTDPTFLFDLTISYDGSFQKHRVNSSIVEENFNLLLKKNIPFNISYTILDYNANYSTIVSDLSRILFTLILPQENYQNKIRINFDMKRIEKKYGCSFSEYFEKLKGYLNCLYARFRVPICHVVCDMCHKCRHQDTGYESLAYLSKQNSIVVQKSRCDREFDLF